MRRKLGIALIISLFMIITPVLSQVAFGSVQVPVKVPKFPSLIRTLYELNYKEIVAGPCFDGRNLILVQNFSGKYYLTAVNAITRKIVEMIKLDWVPKQIFSFSWKDPYGNNATGVILEGKEKIEVFPDFYGVGGYWNQYSLNLSEIKATYIKGPYGYFLQELSPGDFKLYKIYLPNGEVCWSTTSLEMQSEVYARIERAEINYSYSIKDPITFLQNYEVIFSPLYHFMLNSSFRMVSAGGMIFLSLPLGPIIGINESTGSAEFKILSDVLPENYTGNLSGPIVSPFLTSFSYQGNEYVVAYSPYTGYIKAIEEWSKGLGIRGMGNLSGDPGVLLINVTYFLEKGVSKYTFLDLFSSLASKGIWVKEEDYNSTSLFFPSLTSSEISKEGPFIFYGGNDYGYSLPVTSLETSPYSLFPRRNITSGAYSSDLFLFTYGTSGLYLSSRYSLGSPLSNGIPPSFEILTDPAYIQKGTSKILGILTSSGNLLAFMIKFYQGGYSLERIWSYSEMKVSSILELSGVVWALKNDREIRVVSPVYLFPGYPRTEFYGQNVSFSDKYGPKYFDYSLGVWRRAVELKTYQNLSYPINVYYLTYNGSFGNILRPKSWIQMFSPGENGIKVILSTSNGTDILKDLLYGHGFSDYGVLDVMVIENETWHTIGHDVANTYYSTYQIPKKSLSVVSSIPGRPLSLQVWKDKIYSVFNESGNYYLLILDPLGNMISKVKLPGFSSGGVYDGKYYFVTREGGVYEVDQGQIEEISNVIPSGYVMRTFPGGILLINKTQGILYYLSFQGKILWGKFLGSEISSYAIGHWSLFLSVGGNLYAYNLENGYLEWKRDINAKYLLFAVLNYFSEFLVAIDGNGTIFLLDPSIGDLRGEFSILGEISCPPSYDPFSGYLYVASPPYLYRISLRNFTYSRYQFYGRPIEVISSPAGAIVLTENYTITIPIFKGQEEGYYSLRNPRPPKSLIGTQDLLYLLSSEGIYVLGVNPLKVTPQEVNLKAGTILRISVKVSSFKGIPLADHEVYASSKGLKVLSPEVYTSENGTCEILAYSNETGNYTLKIWTYIEGREFVRYVKVRYLSGEPKEIFVYGPKEEVAGSPISFEVKILDEYGNPVPGVEVRARALSGNITPASYTDSSGIAFFSYLNYEAGYDGLTFYVPGTSLKNYTYVRVLPSSPYSMTFVGSLPQEVYVGEPYQASVRLLDKYGNYEGPGYKIEVFLNGRPCGTIKTNEEGIATFLKVFNSTGSYFITFVLEENRNVTLTASLKVLPAPPARMILRSYSPEIEAGTPFNIEVQVLNIYGKPVQGATVEFYIDNVLKASYVTNQQGIVSASSVIYKAGSHQAKLVLKGYKEICVEVSFEVVPSKQIAPSVSISTNETMAGNPFQLSVVLKDKYGNLFSGEIQVIVDNVFRANYYVKGEKEVNVTIFKAGGYTLSVYYNGEEIWSHKIVVLPAYPEKILAEPIVEFEAGASQGISVKVLDKYGNPVPGVNVSLCIREFPAWRYYAKTDLQGEAILHLNITKEGNYTATICCYSAYRKIEIVILPSKPVEILPITTTKIIAGEEVKLYFKVLDKYNNTIGDVPYSISYPSWISIEQISPRTTFGGILGFTVYSTREGEYPVGINFPEYNVTLIVNLYVEHSPKISLEAEIQKTSYSVGEEMVITYYVKDKYGNPIKGVIAAPVVTGVTVKITSVIKTNDQGVGYITIVPTSKGYGEVYLQYLNCTSNVIYFTVGNAMLLNIESWISSYWWSLIIIGFGIFFGALFAKYMRTIGRWKSKLRRPLGQASWLPRRSQALPFLLSCICMLHRP